MGKELIAGLALFLVLTSGVIILSRAPSAAGQTAKAAVVSTSLEATAFPQWSRDLGYQGNQLYPLSLDSLGCPFVEVDVSAVKLLLMLDTGTARGFGITNHAPPVPHRIEERMEELNADGSHRGESFRIRVERMSVLGKAFRNVAGSLSDWRMFSSEPFDGTVGLDFFLDRRLTLDYRSGKVGVSPSPIPEKLDYKRYVSIDLIEPPNAQGNILYAQAKVNGREAIVYFDTGYNVSFIDPEFAEGLARVERSGKFKVFRERVPLELGGRTFILDELRESPVRRGTGFELPVALALGSDVLSHFIVTIDIRAQEARPTVSPVLAQTDEIKLDADQAKITTVSAMRARRWPQIAAEEIMRLKLGTVVNAIARSTNQDTIGGKSDYWYRVTLPNSETGWLFGGLLLDYTPGQREQLLRQIIESRLKAENTEFADRQEIYNLTASSIGEAKDVNTRAEFELLKLLALANWAVSVPDNLRDKSPYREWHKAHDTEVIPNEFGGGYNLRTELLWNLEAKYHTLPIADRIAWEAAKNPQPSDCESDEVCDFFLTEGEIKYLSLQPAGAHAADAVKDLNGALTDNVINAATGKGGDKYAVEQRAALKKTLASLRLAIAKTSAPEMTELLQKLDRISAR